MLSLLARNLLMRILTVNSFRIRAINIKGVKFNTPFLQVIKEKLDPSGIVIFAGDLSADPGTHGGPLSTTPANEQGRILARYVQSWGVTSAHLHLSDTPSSNTFENPSKKCKSTIDH